MTAALRVVDDATRDELEEALGHLVHAAKRVVPVVGTDEYPTAWDKAHKLIDVRLTEWQACR